MFIVRSNHSDMTDSSDLFWLHVTSHVVFENVTAVDAVSLKHLICCVYYLSTLVFGKSQHVVRSCRFT